MVKNKSIFKRVLIGFIAVCMAILAVSLIVLWNFLADYQSSLPETIANDILMSYEKDDVSSLKEYIVDDYDISELKNIVNKDDIFLYCAMQTSNEVVYHIVNNGHKLSEIKLCPRDKSSHKGFDKYKIKSIENFPTPINISMPADGELTINRKKIDLKKIEKIETKPAVKGINYEVSSFTVFEFAPINTISVTLDGRDCKMTKDSDNYTAELLINEEQEKTVKIVSELFTKEYMKYATKKSVPSYNVLKYVKNGTDLHDFIVSYSNYWGEICTDESFPKLEVSNFKMLGKNHVCCDVSAIYHIVLQGGHDQDSPFEYQLVLEFDGDDAYVEQMSVLSE